jgi:hypothetical protein
MKPNRRRDIGQLQIHHPNQQILGSADFGLPILTFMPVSGAGA